jgi:hypothetical protein
VPNQTAGRRSAAPPAYASYPSLSPPPLAAPAVLSYLSLATRPSTGADTVKPWSPLVPSSVSPQVCMSSEWDCEWERCKRLAGIHGPTSESPSGTFKPGTMEGIWEGLFTVSLLLLFSPGGTPFTRWNASLVPRSAFFIVHRIHGICRTAVRRASTDTEQDPGRPAPADMALARVPLAVAERRGRVRGRNGARGPTIQTFIAR